MLLEIFYFLLLFASHVKERLLGLEGEELVEPSALAVGCQDGANARVVHIQDGRDVDDLHVVYLIQEDYVQSLSDCEQLVLGLLGSDLFKWR